MNFCLSCMESTISSTKLSADGFEVNNLLNSHDLKKGFQVERFAQTPVSVSIQFAIPIQIKYILLTPYIGQQCAKEIRVYTLHSKNYQLSHNVDHDQVIFCAGKTILSNPTTVCFRNKYYKENSLIDEYPFSDERTPVVVLQGKLYSVIAVKITLRSMLNGSVPSIAKLEVWGFPAFSCKNEIVQNFLNKWSQHQSSLTSKNETPYAVEEPSTQTKKKIEHVNKVRVDCCDSKRIPKEFLDPLTFSVMKRPVLLPGGQTVDQSTLDKHILSQSDWGRPPTDPFTGIPFAENYQPSPNLNLKSKIDKYELSNAIPSVFGECSYINSVDKVVEHSNSRKRKQSLDGHFSKDVGDFDYKSFSSNKPNKNLRIIQVDQNRNNPFQCANCKTYFSLLSSHYLLPCDHRLCRSCLLSATHQHACPNCKSTFSQKDVQRTHS